MAQIVNSLDFRGMIGDAGRAVRARGQAGLLASGQAVVFERLAGQIAMFAVMGSAFLFTLVAPGGFEWPQWLAIPVGLMIAAALALPILVRDTAAGTDRAEGKVFLPDRWNCPLRQACLAATGPAEYRNDRLQPFGLRVLRNGGRGGIVAGGRYRTCSADPVHHVDPDLHEWLRSAQKATALFLGRGVRKSRAGNQCRLWPDLPHLRLARSCSHSDAPECAGRENLGVTKL